MDNKTKNGLTGIVIAFLSLIFSIYVLVVSWNSSSNTPRMISEREIVRLGYAHFDKDINGNNVFVWNAIQPCELNVKAESEPVLLSEQKLIKLNK